MINWECDREVFKGIQLHPMHNPSGVLLLHGLSITRQFEDKKKMVETGSTVITSTLFTVSNTDNLRSSTHTQFLLRIIYRVVEGVDVSSSFLQFILHVADGRSTLFCPMLTLCHYDCFVTIETDQDPSYSASARSPIFFLRLHYSALTINVCACDPTAWKTSRAKRERGERP